MQIAVLGLGRFGSQIVRALGQLGHEVLAVDLNEASVERARRPTPRRQPSPTSLTSWRCATSASAALMPAVVSTGVIEASVLARR